MSVSQVNNYIITNLANIAVENNPALAKYQTTGLKLEEVSAKLLQTVKMIYVNTRNADDLLRNIHYQDHISLSKAISFHNNNIGQIKTFFEDFMNNMLKMCREIDKQLALIMQINLLRDAIISGVPGVEYSGVRESNYIELQQRLVDNPKYHTLVQYFNTSVRNFIQYSSQLSKSFKRLMDITTNLAYIENYIYTNGKQYTTVNIAETINHIAHINYKMIQDASSTMFEQIVGKNSLVTEFITAQQLFRKAHAKYDPTILNFIPQVRDSFPNMIRDYTNLLRSIDVEINGLESEEKFITSNFEQGRNPVVYLEPTLPAKIGKMQAIPSSMRTLRHNLTLTKQSIEECLKENARNIEKCTIELINSGQPKSSEETLRSIKLVKAQQGHIRNKAVYARILVRLQNHLTKILQKERIQELRELRATGARHAREKQQEIEEELSALEELNESMNTDLMRNLTLTPNERVELLASEDILESPEMIAQSLTEHTIGEHESSAFAESFEKELAETLSTTSNLLNASTDSTIEQQGKRAEDLLMLADVASGRAGKRNIRGMKRGRRLGAGVQSGGQNGGQDGGQIGGQSGGQEGGRGRGVTLGDPSMFMENQPVTLIRKMEVFGSRIPTSIPFLEHAKYRGLQTELKKRIARQYSRFLSSPTLARMPERAQLELRLIVQNYLHSKYNDVMGKITGLQFNESSTVVFRTYLQHTIETFFKRCVKVIQYYKVIFTLMKVRELQDFERRNELLLKENSSLIGAVFDETYRKRLESLVEIEDFFKKLINQYYTASSFDEFLTENFLPIFYNGQQNIDGYSQYGTIGTLADETTGSGESKLINLISGPNNLEDFNGDFNSSKIRKMLMHRSVSASDSEGTINTVKVLLAKLGEILPPSVNAVTDYVQLTNSKPTIGPNTSWKLIIALNLILNNAIKDINGELVSADGVVHTIIKHYTGATVKNVLNTNTFRDLMRLNFLWDIDTGKPVELKKIQNIELKYVSGETPETRNFRAKIMQLNNYLLQRQRTAGIIDLSPEEKMKEVYMRVTLHMKVLTRLIETLTMSIPDNPMLIDDIDNEEYSGTGRNEGELNKLIQNVMNYDTQIKKFADKIREIEQESRGESGRITRKTHQLNLLRKEYHKLQYERLIIFKNIYKKVYNPATTTVNENILRVGENIRYFVLQRNNIYERILLINEIMTMFVALNVVCGQAFNENGASGFFKVNGDSDEETVKKYVSAFFRMIDVNSGSVQVNGTEMKLDMGIGELNGVITGAIGGQSGKFDSLQPQDGGVGEVKKENIIAFSGAETACINWNRILLTRFVQILYTIWTMDINNTNTISSGKIPLWIYSLTPYITVLSGRDLGIDNTITITGYQGVIPMFVMEFTMFGQRQYNVLTRIALAMRNPDYARRDNVRRLYNTYINYDKLISNFYTGSGVSGTPIIELLVGVTGQETYNRFYNKLYEYITNSTDPVLQGIIISPPGLGILRGQLGRGPSFSLAKIKEHAHALAQQGVERGRTIASDTLSQQAQNIRPALGEGMGLGFIQGGGMQSGGTIGGTTGGTAGGTVGGIDMGEILEDLGTPYEETLRLQQ